MRRALDGTPFFARGRLALLLLSTGTRDEAGKIWQVLTPHLGQLPRSSVEWLVAHLGPVLRRLR